MKKKYLSKIVSTDQLSEKISFLKEKGAKIVATNGCFDILHPGHIQYLYQAKDLGNFLVVGINSDVSIKFLKGKNRPINNELFRSEMVAALEFVDIVCIFNEINASSFLRKVSPNVYVKGSDYSNDLLEKNELNVLLNLECSIKFVPLLENYSSTKIIEKIKKL